MCVYVSRCKGEKGVTKVRSKSKKEMKKSQYKGYPGKVSFLRVANTESNAIIPSLKDI